MNLKDTLKELEKIGTAQNRKVYAKHGAQDPIFGVSYAHLGSLKKKIKTDHELALALWDSGYHDARVFATMIADPKSLDNSTIEKWAKDLTNYILTDALAGFVSESKWAHTKMKKWIKSPKEWIGRAGWLILVKRAMSKEELGDIELKSFLSIIEKDIHKKKNRVRDAMNSALMAIGIYHPNLTKVALATAAKIGKVEVDHGETGCKTPEAIPYIKKAIARRSTTGMKK